VAERHGLAGGFWTARRAASWRCTSIPCSIGLVVVASDGGTESSSKKKVRRKKKQIDGGSG
jgi:hypothetical protein